MKEIKRAYRRMALIYHPDARTTSNATKEERQIANDDFARINEAYAFLMSRISKDKPLRIPMPADTNANMPQTTQPTARSTATSTARTPKHTQSERKKKQWQQQQHKSRTSATNSSFYDSVHAHRQSYSSNNSVNGVNGVHGVHGYDINGNPRTSGSASSSSSRRTKRASGNGHGNGNNGSPRSHNNNRSQTSTSTSTSSSSSSSNTKRANNNARSHTKRDPAKWNPFSSNTHRAHGSNASSGSHTNHSPDRASSTPSSPHTKRTNGHNCSTPSSPHTKRTNGNVNGNVNGNGNGNGNVNNTSNSNRAKTTSTFSKGEIVEITGGSYVGRSGTVRNVYPTMVKVAISASVDCFVDNEYVKRCTAGSSSESTARGPHSSSSHSNGNAAYDYGHDEFNVAFGFTTANYSNNDSGGDFQNPYGNYVEDVRTYNVNRETVKSMHSTGELIKSSHSPLPLPLIDNSDYDSGSYSWTPSAGSAHKTENIYLGRNSSMTYHGP